MNTFLPFPPFLHNLSYSVPCLSAGARLHQTRKPRSQLTNASPDPSIHCRVVNHVTTWKGNGKEREFDACMFALPSIGWTLKEAFETFIVPLPFLQTDSILCLLSFRVTIFGR